MRSVIAIWTFIIIMFVLLLWASGCNSGWLSGRNTINQPPTPSGQLWHTVKKSNWLVTLAIPIIALGAVAMFNGAAKLGMSAIIFGAVNLFMALATARFALWMGIFGLIGSGLAVAASILAKNKALKEIICGVQKYRKGYGEQDESRQIIDAKLKQQSPSTKKLVQKVKTDLKIKGEI